MATCCTDYSCSGADCVYFSNWTFAGADLSNTDACDLYASCDTFGSAQQVEIYKDVGLTSLVAIGQRTGAGTITLEERNSSGLTGTVDWGGTAVTYPSFLTLFCETSSSSSSSSSIDSSSSSGFSNSTSSSSSDSFCCVNPICVGLSECSNFSAWTFSGMTQGNTDNCLLYAVFDEVAVGEQQVRVYKDSIFGSLVAAGQRLGAGSITLIAKNGSGLSGTVTWNGTIVSGSVSAILDCDLSSSSSSSSLSSLSSSSSSSSSSISSSSSSSVSSQSSSSSSSESSSSSSIDSSSTSSESVGNTSSSSSSSLLVWNKIKPLILGMSSVNSVTIKNRLAQTISIVDDAYSIGKVYCYLYGSFGLSDAFTVHLDVYLCNDDGSPSSILSSKTLAGSSVTQDGWYEFDFGISGITPTNRLLSFVLWQENGDENNYVLWGYNSTELEGTSAWFSSNASTWMEQENVVRALKIVGDFDAYDLTNFRLLSPPAEEEVVTQGLGTATLSGLKIVPGGDYDADRVVIDHPDFICSFVIDSSGSMGWNDRFNGRIAMAQALIDRFKGHYPSEANVLFDILKFGSVVLDTDTIISDLSRPMTINIDLYSPTRTTYAFSVSSASASKGAVYEVDGKTYTVIQTANSDSILIAKGEEAPPTNGTLTLQIGSGDATIGYDSVEAANIANNIIAYGFKNFEAGHTYNLAGLSLDGEEYQSVTLTNWQAFLEGGGSVSLALGSNGPDGSDSIDVVGKDGLVLRKVVAPVEIPTTKILANASQGDTSVEVEDSSIVNPDQYVDFIDGDLASLSHQVSELNPNEIFLSSGLKFDIRDWNNDRGIAQLSNAQYIVTVTATTGNILARDINASRSITFYVQTSQGLSIEWDFQPYNQWKQNALYWLGDTALLPVRVFDSNGDPLPDGTRVEFYVGGRPSEDQNEVDSVDTTSTSLIGTDKLYVASTTGFRRGDKVDVVGTDGTTQSLTVEAVGEDITGPFIQVEEILKANFNVGSQIVSAEDAEAAPGEISNSTLLPSFIGMVDTSPIYAGRNLDSSLLAPYDPDPVSPTTDYDDLNLDRDRTRTNIDDLPTIDGCSSIRVLPITEDNVKTIKEKRDEGESLFTPDPVSLPTDQFEQATGDSETAQEEQQDAENQFTTTTTTLLSRGEDYEIDNPVFLNGGFAESSMISYATDLTPTSVDGSTVAGLEELEGNDVGFEAENQQRLIKQYNIYPAVVIQDSNGTTVAKQYIDPFEIEFAPPVAIEGVYDEAESGTIPYWTDNGLAGSDKDCPGKHQGFSLKSAPGVYATDGSVKIDYIVTDRETLLKSGTLNVRVYTNPVVNLDKVVGERASFLTSDGKVSSEGRSAYRRQDLNVILPQEVTVAEDGTTQTTQPTTDITAWIEAVENNPQAQRLADVSDTASAGLSQESQASLLTGLAGNEVTQAFLNGLNSFGYEVAGQETTEPPAFEWYTNPQEWTVATQYGDAANQTIAIVNGKATLELPATDVTGLIMVQAYVTFGDADQFQMIRSNLFVSASPIGIGLLTPDDIYIDGEQSYEISTTLTWIGQPIVDNVLVNFGLTNTDVVPSVSKTDGGVAAGVRVGPHAPVVMTCPLTCSTCFGEYETVTITASYLGYERTVNRVLEWRGPVYEVRDQGQPGEFPILVESTSGSPSGWADGNDTVTLEADLNNPTNQLWVGPDGIEALKGKDQVPLPEFPLGAPRPVRWDGGLLLVKPNQERWITDVSTAEVTLLNANIGYLQPQEAGCCPKDNEPWKTFIEFSTSYREVDSEGNVVNARLGKGVTSRPYPSICEGGVVICWPRFEVNLQEPLGVELSLEALDGAFVRDGVASPNIVAEVTWKGQPITSRFTVNEGKKDETVIDYPLPDVVFESGECSEFNIEPDSDPATAKDVHYPIGACLTVDPNADAQLNSYVAPVELSRTDIYEGGEYGSHTHAVTVDDDGNGTTTNTIILVEPAIEDHTHVVENFVAKTAGNPSHTHNLRSVAIVQLLPTVNPSLTVSVTARVDYNPTNVSGGRYMGDSLSLSSAAKPRELILTLDKFADMRTGEGLGNAYTSETVTDTERGFDIVACANFSSYSVEVEPGRFVLLPEEPVPDGTRMTFDINVFRAPQVDSDTLIVGTDQIREYMYMDITVSLTADGLTASSSLQIKVLSDLQWVPGIKRLVPEMTNDSIYISEALAQINTLGASQIHDAVKQAAQNIIQYQTDNEEWKSSKKAIMLLTDGDENTSEFSIDQAIDNVQFVNGTCETPVVPIKLGYSYSSDSNLLRKYADETCGRLTYLIDGTTTDIQNLVDDLVVGETLGINDGLYSDIIDLGSDNVPLKFSIDNISLPANSRALFRYRFSSDATTWSVWSEWFDTTVEANFELNLESLGRYFQYQIQLFGNELFESPQLYTGATLNYFKSQSFITFFQPIDLDINSDEYLASIHITHEATVPDTSEIEYGFVQFDSVNVDDYSGVTRPAITPDRHTIILTRYNERFLTDDRQTYTAINGRWPDEAEIEIYRINEATPNGFLVNPSEYSVNSNTGQIKFVNIQDEDDDFVLCVYFDPTFRVICSIRNYGPEAAFIDHIGLLYNVTKRIPRDSDGSIIHTPIDERI